MADNKNKKTVEGTYYAGIALAGISVLLFIIGMFRGNHVTLSEGKIELSRLGRPYLVSTATYLLLVGLVLLGVSNYFANRSRY